MGTTDKMRVAMVGVGGFGGYRRARMRETGLFQLVAAYDINAQALAQCQAEDGAAIMPSFDALLATPDIEALIISTGGKYHAAQAIAGMERGLHVFIEKPLCSTPEEVTSMVEAQQRTGVVVGTGHNDLRHDSAAVLLKSMLEDGTFGTVVTFEEVTAHSGGLEIKPGDWRGDPEKNPGGMLFQCGVHALHELIFYFGPVARVTAMMRYDANPQTATADVAHCILQFASGMMGTLSAYHITPYHHSLTIYGTKKTLYRDGRAPGYGDPSYIAFQERGNCVAEKHVPFTFPEDKDICGNLKSFYRGIRYGEPVYPSLFDGAHPVEVVFAAEESAKLGKTVEVKVLTPA